MTGPQLCAILTRPAGQNASLAVVLQAKGCDCLELPALDIEPLAFTPPDLSEVDGVMFVSGNAVRSFLDRCVAQPGWQWPTGVKGIVVGTGSARALRAHLGFPAAAQIIQPAPDSLADSEALWEVLRQHSDLQRLLIVRGGGAGQGRGRDWLGRQLEQAGHQVQRFGAYERQPRVWTDLDRQQLAARADLKKLWLFSSRESVDAIFAQLKQNGLLSSLSSSHLLLTHPRIRDHLVDLLKSEPALNTASALLQVCKPDDQSIVDAIESLL